MALNTSAFNTEALNSDLSSDDRPFNERILGHLLCSASWEKPSTLYCGLLSSVDPVVEVTADTYVRAWLPLGDAAWAQSVNVFTNQTVITFAALDATFSGIGLFHQATGGLCFLSQSLGSARTSVIEQPGPYFPIGFLSLTIL